jgi:uncharacterized protein YjdB
MQIRLRKIFSLFLIFVIVLSSLLFNGETFVQAQDKKTGGIEEVNENVIRGWATSPGEGDGGGNTIKFFIVKVKIKGNNASEVSYRVEATEVPSGNGEKKYTFSLDMTGKWPKSNNSNVTYEIVVDAYRILGNGKEDYYFSFPSPAYEYQKGTSNVNNASLDFNVTPSQSEYAKPLNKDAQGRLDITLTPQGRVDTPLRPPIDVVFVFDVSGSMNELGTDPMKFLSAKQALSLAADYFKNNANPNDRFALIPFSGDVKYDKVISFPNGPYNVTQHLDMILQTATGLSAWGGTNYTQSLQQAKTFFDDEARKKYIIFLTDGEPTFSKVFEQVTYEECRKRKCETITENTWVRYELYQTWQGGIANVWFIDNDGKEREVKGISYEEAKQAIRNHGINTAKELGNNDITLYSIGFGDNNEVDMAYLEKLSSVTSGKAKQGNQQNLAEIFQEFSKQANDPALTGTIKIPLKSFNGKVSIIEDGNVRLDENKENAYISFNINYKVGQGTPMPVNFSVPILFKEKGSYTFNVELNYRDIYGIEQPPMTKSVTVEVKDEVPPTFTGTVQLNGITNEVDNLIKYGNEDGDSNRFIAEYTLNPVGYVGENVTGQLSNIKIIQPIPEGLSVVPSSNVSVRQENGKTYADISLLDVVHYSNNSFTPTALTASVKLQADWAMENMQLPQATVSFTDSRYGNQVTTLPASNPIISMKVRLAEFPDIYYEADSRGIISKWRQSLNSSSLIASASYLNNRELLNQPVRAMTFKPGTNDTVIVITYKNGETSELYMLPQLKVVKDDGTTVPSGATVTELVKVAISHLVAGDGVAYEYQIINNRIPDTSWKPLNAPFEIPINVVGTSVIKVRSIGGFTKGDGIATVEITYHKLVNQIVLEPYKNEMNVNEVQTLQATVLPSDATNKNVKWSSSNPLVASVENGVVTALSPGNVTIYVEAQDGSGVSATANITVVDPTVPLESIRFRQPTLSITLGEKIPVVSLLEFNPSNATNKQLDQVLSSASQYVEIKKENGEWYISAKDYGYSTVTAIAEEKTKDGQDIKDSIVIIVAKSSNGSGEGNNGGGTGSDMPKGRW